MEPLTMLLGGLASQALPDIYQWGKNKLFGPGPQDPNVLAQQNYLQQIQQPINMGMGNRAQQLINDYQQNLIPGIQEQFAGAGGARSSAFGQQLGSALGNLQTNLGALGEENEFRNQQLNQQRLGELRGYLGQQQGFGLQGQELRQRGLGQMQNYMLGQRGHDVNQMRALSDLVQGLSRQGLAPQFETVNRPGQAAQGPDAIMNMIRAYMGMRG